MSLGSVTVDTTTGGVTILAASASRRAVLIKSMPTNTQIVYLKMDDSETALTAANGYPLSPGEDIMIEREGNSAVNDIKGITSTGSADIRVTGF